MQLAVTDKILNPRVLQHYDPCPCVPAGSSDVLGIYKGYHDIASALGGGEAFVVVGQTARVHQSPANTERCHTAVISEEPHSTALGDNTV